jgi:hypothetical protein
MLKVLLQNIVTVVVLLIAAFQANAQNAENAKDFIRQKIEEISDKYELNLDYSDVVDVLYYYYQHPLNLNTATAEDLRQLGLLSELQINNLLNFRKKNGNFQTIYELRDVEGFNYVFINDIRVFFTVAPPGKREPFKIRKALKYGRSDLFVRYGQVLQRQLGYQPVSDSALAANPNSHYLGNPSKVYFRYRFTYRNRLSIGLVGDKDAGEEFFRGSNPYGFDFYSAHIFIRDFGMVKAAVVGDYHLEFGQGLTMWSGIGFGKSVDVLGVQKVARGIRPNTSANENLYFRGAATTIGLSDAVKVTAFYSNKNLDAGLQNDTLNAEELYYKSIQETGMHRTPAEIAKKHAVNEQIFGGNFSFDKSGFHIGATAYKTIYSKDLKKDPQPYQIYDFQGNNNFNAGVDFRYSVTKAGFFGEVSVSQNGGYAMLAGMVADLSPRYKMSLVYRDFLPEYQVIYAVPFSESTGAKNEKGLFLGALLYTGRSGSISAYYDIFSFPWLRYRVNAPSQGDEFLIQYQNEVSRNLTFYIRLKSENKTLNNTVEGTVVSPAPVLKRSIRTNFRYEITQDIILQTRVEGIRYEHQPAEPENGYLLFQDINYRPQSLPFDISFRYAVFSTDDYDTRIYAYENDVLYKFSIPAYYYKGQRIYLMLHSRVLPRLDLWLRFSNTTFFDRETIGTGTEMINGNNKSEVTLQLRWKF